MSLTLLLRSTEALAPSAGGVGLTFDGGRVVIGRGSGCDLRLPDPSVSARHATVRTKGREYALVAEKSTNGTFVGAMKLAAGTPHALKDGDLVRVGRVWLEVRIDQTPATQEPAAAARDLALALVAHGMHAVGRDATVRMHAVEGPDTGAVLALEDEGRAYVIGRGPKADAALSDPVMGASEIQIVRRGGTVLVRDAGSMSGAWLGETRLSIERDVAWRPAMPLRAGSSTFALEEPAAEALAELEAAEDQAVAPEDVPPMPSPDPPPAARPAAPSRPDLGRPAPPPSRAPARPSRWSSTDLAVLVAALSVLGLSLAGLVWLLRM